MPEPTTAPVTDLRERIEASFGPAMRMGLQDAELHGERGAQRIEEWITSITDAVLAALAGDPGDLPARMAEAMHAADCGCPDDNDPRYDRVAAAAMSVRSEDTVRLAAENGELRARAEHAEGELSARREHETRWQAEHAEVERLRAELAEIKRITTPPTDEEMPADPAELQEMWEFINRQTRWQWHMAHKFGDQVERLRAERDLLRETLAESDLGAQVLAQFEAIAAADADRDRLAGERDAARKALRSSEARHRILLDESEEVWTELTARIPSEVFLTGESDARAGGRWIAERLAEGDALKAAIEGFLRSNAERLRSGDATADLADLAESYWKLTGWGVLNARPDDPEEIRRLAQATTENTEETNA